jgi:hypothetical protein
MEPRGSGTAVAKVIPLSGQTPSATRADHDQGNSKTPAALTGQERVTAEPYEKELGEISPEISKSEVRLPLTNREILDTDISQASDLRLRDGAHHHEEADTQSSIRPIESEENVPTVDREKSASPSVQPPPVEEDKPEGESEQKQPSQDVEQPAAVMREPTPVEREDQPKESDSCVEDTQAPIETAAKQDPLQEASVLRPNTEEDVPTSPQMATLLPATEVAHEDTTDAIVPATIPEYVAESQTATKHTELLPPLDSTLVAHPSQPSVPESETMSVPVDSPSVAEKRAVASVSADPNYLEVEKQGSPKAMEDLPLTQPEQPTTAEVPISSPHAQLPSLSRDEVTSDIPDMSVGHESQHTPSPPSPLATPPIVAGIQASEAVSSGPCTEELRTAIANDISEEELRKQFSAPMNIDRLTDAEPTPIGATNQGDGVPESEGLLSSPSTAVTIDVRQKNMTPDAGEEKQTVAPESLTLAVTSPHMSAANESPNESRLASPTQLAEQADTLPASTTNLQYNNLQPPVSHNLPLNTTPPEGTGPSSSTMVDPPSDTAITTASVGQAEPLASGIPAEKEAASDQIALAEPTNATEANPAESALTQFQPSQAKARYVDPETLRRRFERQAIIGRFDVIQYARNKKKELELKVERLQREYAKLDKEWDSHKSRITAQNEEVTRQLDAISNPATAQEPKPGGRKTRRGFVEQDHELMGFRDGDEEALAKALKAIEQMMESDPTQRALKTEAIVPDMELDPDIWRLAYNDDNSLVLDPITFYEHGKGEKPGEWTDDEERKFRKLYAAYPKQFGDIAKGLPGKTAAQCVKHYYLTKKKRPFKEGASKNAQRQASGGQSARMVAPVTHEKLELAGVLATGDRAQAKQVADAVRPSGDSKKGKKKTDDIDRSGDLGSRAEGQKVKKKTSSKKRLLPSQDPLTPRDRSAASDASSAKRRKTQAKRPARLDLTDGRAKSVANRSSVSGPLPFFVSFD